MTVNVCICEIQRRCELTAVNRLHILCLQDFCNLLFRVLLHCSSAILFTLSLYLSVFSLIPAVQLFTHSLQSLPTITCSPPEILIMNKSTKVMLPCLEPVQSSPISLSDSAVPRAGTPQTNASCPHSLLFNPDFLSAQPHKPFINTGDHFLYKLFIWTQELWNTTNTSKCVMNVYFNTVWIILGVHKMRTVSEGEFSSIKLSTSVNERQPHTQLTVICTTAGQWGNHTGQSLVLIVICRNCLVQSKLFDSL